MSNYLQQRQMNAGLNYSSLQSKKKLQPISQSSQQQQQQQLMLQGNVQNQQTTQQNQQIYTLQNQSSVYNSVNAQAGTVNNSIAHNSANSPPFLNNYYFGSVMNSNYSGNQHQLQHQIAQQHQNTNKQLASTNSPKSFFGTSGTSIANNSGYLDSSLNISKQKTNISNLSQSNASHSTQVQQQLQQQQQQQQQSTAPLLSNTPQQNSQQLTPISQSPALHSQNQSSADLLYSPNTIKSKKLYIDTNNNFYFSQQNVAQISNLKLGGNLSTQSNQSNNSSKGFSNVRKNQQKPQRSPILQSQQSPNMISQSGLNALSNTSPSTTVSSSGLNFLNGCGASNLNNSGQNGSFNLNMSNNSINSNNSQNMSVPYSDEQRFIKKTQHFVKGLTSLSGTWNGNNQEEIDDLDESVLEMMKDFNLYEQAQKGNQLIS